MESKFNGFLANFTYAIIPHDLRATTTLTELDLVNFIDLLPLNSITDERWHDYLVIVKSNLLVLRESPADWSKTESHSLLTKQPLGNRRTMPVKNITPVKVSKQRKTE